jgi:tetratricopeptide (TPR) repeat protein
MVKAAWGRDYALKGMFKKAIPFYFSAFQMVNPDDIEERSYLAQLCNFIGDAYLNLGRPDSAMVFFQKGMRLSRKYQIYYGSIINALGLARLNFGGNDFLQSVLYCDSVIYFGNKIDSSGSFYGIAKYNKLLGMSGEHYIPMNNEFKRFLAWRIMAGAYQIQLRISEQQGEYRNALQINIELNKINDSIAYFQKRTEILDLLHKYQAEQKDDEITLLYQENQIQSFKIGRSRFILFSVAAISILLLFVLILLLRQHRIKSERRVAEFKQKLLRSQMNPHFIFNSLTSVQNFILQHDDIKASVYLSRFSDLVRGILKNSMAEQITLEEELGTIENYLELQKIRYQEKFDYKIEMQDAINPESIQIPPMLAQPFIENAIEHGFKQKGSQGNIYIRLKLNKRYLIYEIEDDGIGREKAQEILQKQKSEHKSLATSITQERIKVLNRKLKHKIKFEILDLKDDEGKATGTRVVFKLPV